MFSRRRTLTSAADSTTALPIADEGTAPLRGAHVRAPVGPVTDVDIPLLEIILRRWPLLLVCTLVPAVATAIIASIRPASYEATATLLVSTADSSPAAQASAVTNARTLLENRATAARVVEKFHLDQPPDSLTAVEFVSERLQIVQVRDTNYLRASLRLSSPAKARDALSAFVTESVELNRQLGVDSTINVSGGLLTKQLDEARRTMEQASADLLELRQKVQLERLQREADTSLYQRDRLAELDAAIAAERSRISMAETELAGRVRRPGAPTATAANPLLESARKSDDNPRQAPLTGGGDSVYEVLDYEAASARIRAQSLEAERTAIVKQLSIPRLGPLYDGERQLEELELNRRLAADVYSDLVIRFEEMRRAAVSRHVNIVVADPASASDASVSPRVWTSSVVAGALGFAGTMLVLVGFSYWVPPERRRVQS